MNNKFEIGDIVTITNMGETYRHYEIFMDKYFYKFKDNWKYNELPKLGDIGHILGYEEHEYKSQGILYLVAIDDRVYIIGEIGLTLSHVTPLNDIKSSNVDDFELLQQEELGIYILKNDKYGDSFGTSVRKYGMISALTRMSDKWNRIENLILTNDTGTDDESLIDSLMDLSNYANMTIMELKKK